jgi:NifB/MoaA-like Fe-S oxidoreductase
MPEAIFRVAREYDVVRVRVTEEGQARVERLTAENRCLGCEAEHQAEAKVTCGQCATCYPASMRAIRNKQTTRSQLIRDGKMLPPTKGGRKPANKFTQELAEL